MKRRHLAAVALALFMALGVATPVLAHPLGNFTVNRFSGIRVSGSAVHVLYIVDYAEIPAFQEKQRMAADPAYLDAVVHGLAGNLHLTVDSHPVALAISERSLAVLPGQGGLETLRLQVALRSPQVAMGAHSATFQDGNFPERLGWKEIIVDASGGGSIQSSSVPATSASDSLRNYPQDRLSSPLNVTHAEFRFTPGFGDGAGPAFAATNGALNSFRDRFAALILVKDFSLQAIAFALLVALGLGALHALEPGHGKAVMAGYLVGMRGGRREAIVLGLSITATHTAGVFALGLITLYAAGYVTPERLYPWLTLISGLVILAIGGRLLLSSLQRARRMAATSSDDPGHDHHRAHDHDQEHDHHHDHDHDHDQENGHGHHHGPVVAGSPLRLRNLIALGASGGLIPCPSALVVLLAAISFHRVAFGMLLIVFFSAGLAIVLSGIGMALAGGGRFIGQAASRVPAQSRRRLVSAMPVVSAALITAAGAGLSVQALGGFA